MADIEIKICTFCGQPLDDADIQSNVWYCKNCGCPQSGEPQNESSTTVQG